MSMWAQYLAIIIMEAICVLEIKIFFLAFMHDMSISLFYVPFPTTKVNFPRFMLFSRLIHSMHMNEMRKRKGTIFAYDDS